MKNINRYNVIGILAIAGALAMTGCGKKAETPGIGEKTGATLDQTAEKTAEAAKSTAEAVKDTTGRAIEKTGELIQKAGAATEKAGGNMQN